MMSSIKDFPVGTRVIVGNYGEGIIIDLKPPLGKKGYICVLLDVPIELSGKFYNRYWTFAKDLKYV